ncbi:MAG: hypothetical protein QG657_5534, partial [Acidobacteriota bacterium]|nr:hypothetical protein [Acidobacteriota bacterium]
YKPKKKQYPMGLTYKCYDKIEPQEATTNEEVKGSEHHASKLWPHQWEDPEKPCHSIYLHPVKQEGTTPSIFGVLKVENKLKLTLEPMEIGGFTPQDKFVVKMFADAIALLLRRNHIYYGKPYTPYQMYGKPILEYLQDKDFLKSLETFAEKQQLCRCLQKFAREKQSQKSEWRTLAEYSNEVVDKAKEIASIFGCQDMANTLLSRMRDYEILLKEIPAYRHHFVHQFNVFLLGIVILSKTKKILDKFINNIDKKNILKEWFLSAMFHDIGLPIEKLNQVFQAFVKGSLNLPHNVDVQFSPFSILSIEDYYKSYYRMEKSIMGLFSDIAVQKEVGSVLHSLAFPSALGKTSHNHSLISATMVEKEFQKKNLGKDSMDRILAAIIFHEGRVAQSLYKRIECPERVKSEISLSKNPLIFLLAICDVIQNWGRPESEGEISHSSVDEFGSINLKELSFTGESKVDIHLKYDTKPSNWKHILKNVITPQLKIWRNNVKSLYITIWFEDDNTTFGNVSFNYEKDSEGGE